MEFIGRYFLRYLLLNLVIILTRAASEGLTGTEFSLAAEEIKQGGQFDLGIPVIVAYAAAYLCRRHPQRRRRFR
jgi:hypothetical protein